MRKLREGGFLVFLLVILAGCASRPPVAPIHVSGKTVVFQGLISTKSVDEFVHLIERHDVNRVLIASGGGHVVPALRMAKAIFDRGMDVEVFGLCFSSCANYIFPAGKNKSITGLGIVGWHGNMQHLLYLHRTGEVPMKGAWLDEVSQAAALESEFFRTIGVNPFVCWFGKIAPYKVRDTYFLSASDMARFGIGSVTVRADYPLTDLSFHNASGVENVRYIEVNGGSLPPMPFESL